MLELVAQIDTKLTIEESSIFNSLADLINKPINE